MTHNTTNEKAADATNANGLHTDTTEANFPTAGATGKAPAMLIAELAIKGHVVHKGQAGDYLVCKYGMSRWCKDVAELESFSRKLGVIHE